MAHNVMRKCIAATVFALIATTVIGQQLRGVQPVQEMQTPAEEAPPPLTAKVEMETKANDDLKSLAGDVTVKNAESAVKAAKALADALGKLDLDSGKIASVIKKFAGSAKYFGALGAVMGVADLFRHPGVSPVIKELNGIGRQISAFQKQATALFNEMDTVINNDACKVMYFPAIAKIQHARQKLMDYHASPDQSSREDFMGVCQYGSISCGQSTYDLIDALQGTAGSAGCDLMTLAYNGVSEDGFFKGSLRTVQSYVGERVMVAAHGIAVQSAFEAMLSNNASYADTIASQYQSRFQDVTTRWIGMLNQTYRMVPENVKFSAGQWTAKHVDLSADVMTNQLAGYLRDNYGSSHLFTVFAFYTGDDLKFHVLQGSKGSEYVEVKVTRKTNSLNIVIPYISKKELPRDTKAIQWLHGNVRNAGFWKVGPSKNPYLHDLSFRAFGTWTSKHSKRPTFAYNTTGNVSKYAFYDTYQMKVKHVPFGWATPRYITYWYFAVQR